MASTRSINRSSSESSRSSISSMSFMGGMSSPSKVRRDPSSGPHPQLWFVMKSFVGVDEERQALMTSQIRLDIWLWAVDAPVDRSMQMTFQTKGDFKWTASQHEAELAKREAFAIRTLSNESRVIAREAALLQQQVMAAGCLPVTKDSQRNLGAQCRSPGFERQTRACFRACRLFSNTSTGRAQRFAAATSVNSPCLLLFLFDSACH